MTSGRSILIALALLCGGNFAEPANASGHLQCAPFARAQSGIELFGRAANWWGEAAERYQRGSVPQVGAVLSFASSRAMPAGHVAVVSKIVGPREILVTHANWSYRGGVERDVQVVDVSANGDWTNVRVWHGPTGRLGQRSNPVNGFIYAGAGPAPVVIAANGVVKA